MKKLALVFAVIMLVCTLFACGNSRVDEGTTVEVTSTTKESTTSNPIMKTSIKQDETTTANRVTTTAATTEKTTVNGGNGSNTTTKTHFSTVTNPTLHDPVEETYFDDAVIVGDSVTLKLSYYISNQKNSGQYPLGKVKFLCSGSLGYSNALWELNREGNVHPRYNGTKYRIPDGVKAIGAKKVFIMLGMNDFMLYGIDGTIENAEKLIGEILQKSPDAKIYVQSVTPIVASRESGKKTNANVRTLNTKLREMCSEHGWTYLDVASVMVDSNGALRASYCSDADSMGIHFTDAACNAWVEYLKSNV